MYTLCIYYTYIYCHRNWLTQLWRPRMKLWRTRKAVGLIQSESKDLRTSRAQSISPSSKMDVPTQAFGKFILPPPFCSIQTLNNWKMPTCTGEGDLYSFY